MSTVPLRALRRSSRRVTAWLALLGLAGCTATITSDELLSRPLSALTDGRRPLTGSINVNVMLDMESIYISRPRELVWPDLLAGYLRLRREALWEAVV